MSQPPLIEVENLTMRFGGLTALDALSMAVREGEILGLIGPNGSGKTTLLEMLLGLLDPTSGRIEVLGDTPQRGNPRIGYVAQNYTAALGDAIRCRDLVTLGVSGTRWGVRRLPAPDRQRVDDALAAVDATDFAHRRMSAVSGGQQQRVAIAQGLVHQPDLLLLDEPLANLDLRNQHEIVSLLGRLSVDTGLTVVVVAHDLNPLLSILHSAVYLLDGHAHSGEIDQVVDEELLSHLYGTAVRVVRTPQGDLFTRSA